MKKIFLKSFVALIISLVLVSFTFNKVEKKIVDTSKSSIEWYAAKITGKHNGSINLKSGSFLFEENKLVGGEFVVDMTTIVCKDLVDKIELKKRLEYDLFSDNFFSVEKYPESSFKITSIGILAPNKYKITGDLTIRGITVENSCVLLFGDNKAQGTLVVDRTKYGMTLRSGSVFENLGNKVIYDEFELKLSLVY
jgi:polyisoprenoid-binding protein YceI